MRTRLLLLALLTACATSVPDNPWTRTYLDDLTAARDAIAANHPGMADAENPAFRATMQSAYDDARRAARQVTGYDSYRVALTRFVNRFQDAHLGPVFKKPFESLRDAGIVVRRRGDAFVVDEVDARYPQTLRGATLVSCDGQPARAHFEKRVLSWRGRPSVEADWHQLAPLLFVDFGPPSPKPPSRCRFGQADVTLQWQPATPERIDALLKDDTTRSLSVDVSDGVIWVNLPTFSVNDPDSIARMNALIAETKAAIARGNWRLIVFDLRGNAGGSASWGQQLATAVFGESWTIAARQWLSDGVYTEWRVSPDNVKAVEGHIKQAEERHGKESDQARGSRRFHDTLSEALARGDALYGSAAQRQGVTRPDPAPVPGRVVVITGPACFSACLDFVDLMRVHSDVVQVGEITGVDTVYMESWGKPLPSGHARISYPMKVYRNRRRGNNEPHPPHVRYAGDLEDTEALRAWVVQRYGQ